MEILPVFVDIPQHVITLELGERTYRYRRTYKPRLRAWYIDIMHADGRLIVGGRRLNGGSFPLGSVVVDFDGVLFVQGPNVYLREDLGGDLFEVFIRAEELPESATEYQEAYA